MHKFLFYVAKNEYGLENLEYGHFETENIIEFSMSYEAINDILPLIHILNDKFGLMIDIYEDELIESNIVIDVIQVSREYLLLEKDLKKYNSVLKFISTLETASKYNSPLQIWW